MPFQPHEVEGRVTRIDGDLKYEAADGSERGVNASAAAEITGLSIDQLRQKLNHRVVVSINEANAVTGIRFLD